MKDKKVHHFTVQQSYNQNTPVSSLLLKGKWLADFGFAPQTKVVVTEEKDGSLTIRKADAGNKE